MHRGGRLRRAQHVPDVVGEERHQGCHQPRHRLQGLVQRGERRDVARPEPAPGPADVPVGQVVEELGQPPPGARGVERLQRLGDVGHGAVELGQRPAVDQRAVGVRGGLGKPRGRPGLGVGVEREEGGRVPVGQQDLPDDLLQGGVAHPPRRPRGAGGRHEPAQRVGAVLVHQRDRLQHVAEVLAHLAAVLGEDQAETEHVLVRRPVEHQRADGHHRVEPATGLVQGLADELPGVGLLEDVVVDVRSAPLGERHGAGVVPGVDDVGDAAGLGAAGRAREGDVVDERPVRVEGRQVEPGVLAQLLQRPDAGHVGLVGRAHPQRQRSAPVTRAGQGPVDVVAEPLAVAALLDRGREPVGALVLGEQAVLDAGGADVPGGERVVEQRRVAPPAVRVAVLEVAAAEQQAAGSEVLGQALVGVLEELAADLRHARQEAPVGADRVDHRQAVPLAGRHVVGAERRRLVDQAGAVLDGDVVGQHHVVGAGDVDQLERPGVRRVLQLGALEALGDRPALAERALDQRLGHDDRPLAVLGRDDVRHAGVDGHGGVGHQRPRRGGPDEQVGALEAAGGHRHAHVDRGAGDVLVPAGLAQLVVGQAGAAARAVRGDAEVAEQQVLVPDDLQRPPDGLDVGGVHRAVGLGHVDPVAHPLGHLLEGVHVAPHRLAAALVELGDAVRLDLGLAGQAELTLDGDLDGQAVAVPARLAWDVEPAHRLVAGEDVLEDTRLDVVHAGHAVGGRRPLEEDPGGAVRVLFERAFEDLAVTPAVEHLRLEGGQVDLRGERAEVGCGHRRGIPPRECFSMAWRDEADGPAVPPSLTSSGELSRKEAHSCHRCRFYWAARSRGADRCRSSGGSGVIFPPALAPGSHRPRVAHARGHGGTRPHQRLAN